jgi:hypothetical protein
MAGTVRRAVPERLGQPLGGEDVAHGARVLDRRESPVMIGLI